ncbi:MAG: LCP family protein, partial [Clostridia bacterium]|nr:LCP family protein [Clostridia bacterium]
MDGKFLGYDIGDENTKSYINVVMLGVDKDGTRTDVIILGQLNMIDNKISMLQIPRDTYVPDNGRSDKKINSAWSAGKKKTLYKEIADVTGLEIDNYVLIDTSQFRNIIDEMGGVEYDVPINMNYDDPYQNLHIHLDRGFQTLDGDMAEQFVRFRQNNNGSGYAGGDVERLEAQQGFIKAAIRQLFSLSNTFKIPKLVSVFSDMIETDLSNAELLSYAPYIFKIPSENINIMTLAGEGRYIGSGSYYVPFDEENRELVATYFTPESEQMNEDEVMIMNEVIGDNHETVEVEEAEPKKKFTNRLVKVDIIDASDGEADAQSVSDTLKYYGYNVSAVTETTSTVYDTTQLVVKSDNGNGENIAAMFGLSSFVINPDKANGTQVTIILGKDMA